MKPRLQQQPPESSFSEPYFIYDVVPYRKGKQLRRRLTAVSFDNLGQLVITMSICSASDTFVKHKARTTATGRVISGITRRFTNSQLYALSFQSVEQFNNWLDDPSKRTLRIPEVMQNHSDWSDDQFYHKEFVNKTWDRITHPVTKKTTKKKTKKAKRAKRRTKIAV